MADRAYQIEATMLGLRHNAFGLFMECGCGKTKVALDIMRRRGQRGQVKRVLVVGPIRVREEWMKQIALWWPAAVVLDSVTDKRPGIYITHYEYAREHYKLLRRAAFDAIILDEGHKLRRRTSKQSRRMHLLGRGVQYKLLLTGTPVEHGELDYWPYMRFLDERVFGGAWSVFADGPVIGFRVHDESKAWCVKCGFKGTKRKLKYTRRQSFLDKVAAISYTIKKENALDLPPIQLVEVPVALVGRQAVAYRQMERDLVVTLPGLTQASELVVTQMIRLQQITGGFLPDDSRVMHKLGSLKLDYVEDVFEEYHKPVVVFARFLPEIAAICKLAEQHGRRVHRIVGGESLQRDESFDVAVVQQSVAAGLDYLKRASLAIFYSKTFSRHDYEQARDRLHRSGQESPVTIISLIAKSTIDELLEHALAMKGDVIAELFQQLRSTNTMAKAATKKVETAAAADEKPAYGIKEISEAVGKEQPLVRVVLRKLNIEKNKGRYGWDKKSEFDAVVKQVKADMEPAPAPKAEKAKKAAA